MPASTSSWGRPISPSVCRARAHVAGGRDLLRPGSVGLVMAPEDRVEAVRACAGPERFDHRGGRDGDEHGVCAGIERCLRLGRPHTSGAPYGSRLLGPGGRHGGAGLARRNGSGRHARAGCRSAWRWASPPARWACGKRSSQRDNHRSLSYLPSRSAAGACGDDLRVDDLPGAACRTQPELQRQRMLRPH